MLTPAETSVLNSIARDALLADLQALIRIKSLGGDETPAQEWMARRLRGMGLTVDDWAIDFPALTRHPAFSMEVPREHGVGVVGTLGDGDGPTFILNGHVDVVPIGDATQWTVDPWDATVRGDLVLGRGSCDMKGGIAAALAALRAIASSGVKLQGRVALHSVIAEEDGGAGTLATLLRGHTGDGALSMEPTELKLAPAHAGALTFRIRVTGVSAHGCVREEGVSALELFRPVHDALLALEGERNVRLQQPLFSRYALPFALSIGKVQTGDWPSSVPDVLVCEGRYGMAPGEDPASAQREFEQAVTSAGQQHPYLRDHPPVVEWWGGQFMPARTAADARVVTTAIQAITDTVGRPPQIEGMTYGADMRLLVNQGRIPTVLFGPGNVRHAHRPDESVPIDDLLVVARVVALTALRFTASERA
ncbi:MAG TPA: ArgE/DapE family deacylase [Vicinamibacterales bacterium]|nr:ArgE/DapE family deacylase [Vicinamibacterales bacterium]